MLPKACEKLMKDKDSPIIDFYPKHFKQDPNGKTAKWLWVVLLPFIDEARLRKAVQSVENKFTKEEKKRNEFGHDLMFFHFNSTEATMLISKGLSLRPDDNDDDNDDGVIIDRMNSFPVCGTFYKTKDFLPRGATVSSPSIATRFPAFTKNMSLAVRFEDPKKKPHICKFLPGAIEPPAVLELDDVGRIKEPKMGRGMRFDDLGMVPVTPEILREETNRAHSIVSNAKRPYHQFRGNASSFRPQAGYSKMTYGGGYVAQSFQAPGKWGSNIVHSEPVRKRPRLPPRHVVDYGQPHHVYGQPRHGYSQPRHGYSQPRHGYSQPRHGYGQPRHGYGQPRHGYGQSHHGYGQPRPTFGQPRSTYGQQQQQYGYPPRQPQYNNNYYQSQPSYQHQAPRPQYNNNNNNGGNSTANNGGGVPSFESLQAMLANTLRRGN